MSHFTVLVAVPASRARDVDAYLAEVLDRWDENREVPPYENEDGETTTYNPDSKWDWWQVGGRWRGYFVPTSDADPARLVFGTGGAFDNDALTYVDERGRTRPRVDGGPVSMLDLDALRGAKAIEAEELWDQYAAAVRGTPESLPWSHFYDRYQAARSAQPTSREAAFYAARNVVNERYGAPLDVPYDDVPARQRDDDDYWAKLSEAKRVVGEAHPTFQDEVRQAGVEAGAAWDASLSYSLDQAREDYGAQPRVRAVRASEHFEDWLFDDPIQVLGHLTREEYAQQQADRAVPGYATIDLGGNWLAPGEMGWFGCSTDDATSYALYVKQVNALVDKLDDDDVLVLLDCHI